MWTMYNPQEKVTTKRRYEFRIESHYDGTWHATLRDVMDTVQVALAKLKDIKGEKAANYDDALHAYPADEHIVFYFEVDE